MWACIDQQRRGRGHGGNARPACWKSDRRPASSTPTAASEAPANNRIAPLDVVAGRHIEAALHHTHGRIEGAHGAARMLRINPHTLRARMRKLRIEWRTFRAADAE